MFPLFFHCHFCQIQLLFFFFLLLLFNFLLLLQVKETHDVGDDFCAVFLKLKLTLRTVNHKKLLFKLCSNLAWPTVMVIFKRLISFRYASVVCLVFKSLILLRVGRRWVTIRIARVVTLIDDLWARADRVKQSDLLVFGLDRKVVKLRYFEGTWISKLDEIFGDLLLHNFSGWSTKLQGQLPLFYLPSWG